MRKTIKLLFAVTIPILFNIKCNALSYGGCNYDMIANLKKLVNNINLSYTYQILDNEAYFNVTLNNIPNEVYFIDSLNQNEYTSYDAANGELTVEKYNNVQNGKYTFYVSNSACKGVKLGTKFYKFPIYNTRSTSELCKDIPNYSLCKRWISKYYSQDEFEKNISDYKKSLEENKTVTTEVKYKKDFISKIVEFYIKYYYYFLPAIIIPCIIIIVVTKRKGKFKL